MRYCKYCGNQLYDDETYCNNCGRPVYQNDVHRKNDSGSFGWALLGFWQPLIGLILYLIWKDEKPRTASRAGKGALVGVILSIVFGIIYFIVIVNMVNNGYNIYQ